MVNKQFGKGKETKPYVVVMSVLLAFVAILIVANVVVMIMHNNKSIPAFPVVPEIDEAEIKKENDFLEYTKQVNEEFQEYLAEEPINVGAANDLINTAINKAIAEDKHDYAVTYIDMRNNGFVAKGLVNEALDAMLVLDFSVYTEPTQYRLYTKVMDLAEILGNEEVFSRFESLREGVSAAYWMDYNATKETVEDIKAAQEKRIKNLTMVNGDKD